jgi:hypothetical protein
MTTTDYPLAAAAHQGDVVNLAATLLGVGAPEGSSIYRPGELFFDILQDDQELNAIAITIEVQAQTSNLPQALAALGVVQLAVDAAAAAVEYQDRYAGDDRADDPQFILDKLANLSPDLGWDLEIVELSEGSIRATLRKLLTTADGRKKGLAVAGLAVAIVAFTIPAWAAGATLAGAVLILGDAFIPPTPPTQALVQLAETRGFPPEKVEQLPAGQQGLATAVRTVPLESVDPQAAAQAQVQKIAVSVEPVAGHYLG